MLVQATFKFYSRKTRLGKFFLGGVLLAFYAGITLLGMYQNKEKKEQQNLFKSPPPSPNLVKNLIKGFWPKHNKLCGSCVLDLNCC